MASAQQTHTLRWTSPPPDATHSAATHIEIHRRASNNPTYGLVTTTDPTTVTLQLSLPGTAPTDRHCYRIRAVNAAGPSPFSNVACTSDPPPADVFIPHAPTALTATINAP